MIKKFLKLLWTFSLSKGWTWLIKTKIVMKLKKWYADLKGFGKNLFKEISDVVKAFVELLDQIGDVFKALFGNKRKGRKKNEE